MVGLALSGVAACGTPAHQAGATTSAVTSPVTSPGASASASATGSRPCGKVGVLLPGTADARWEQQDRPALEKQIPAAASGVQVAFANAGGDAGTQQSQAAADLTAGDCVLLVAPVDPVSAAQIVSAATARKVPVIAYADRIDAAATSYFVGVDAMQVGQLQGQYIADHYQGYGVAGHRNMVVINGAKTDPVVLAQRAGQATRLQPLVDSRSVNKVYDQFTPGSDPATAATEMAGALTANSNNIQIAAVGDDRLATSVIGALAQQHLAGKVLVTGAGATVPALRNILLGQQAMTVYGSPALLAQSAATLIGAVVKGAPTTAMVNGAMKTSDGGSIPAVLVPPVAVDKTNLASTLIDSGWVTRTELCAGVPAGTAGVC